jgi:hypothetical protein
VKIDWRGIDIKDLAALVSITLKENGIDAFFNDTATTEIYTKNRYLSSDLDFVSYASLKEIIPVMKKIGFMRESSRHFVRKDCPFFIEFVSPPASIGSMPVKKRGEIETGHGVLVLFTPTDCVKDRLAAYYHWNDPQSLEQALMVAREQEVNLREIRQWSIKEGYEEKHKIFADSVS